MKPVLMLACVAICGAQTRPTTAVDASIANVSNLPAQKLGANDLIAVSVYDAPELTRTFRIDPDGTIALPMVGKAIVAQGMLPKQLEAQIGTALVDAKLLLDPLVKVTVLEYFSRPISVVGAVHRPVTFQAIGSVTLLEALARAEGLTEFAGREVIVTGPGADQAPRRIAVKDLMDGGDLAANVHLSGGEEITVPEAAKIFVVGNVKKPGAFAVRDSADLSVLKSIALAEGLTPFTGKLAFIYRKTPGASEPAEIPVELRKILKRQAGDVTLQANDILYVPDNAGRRLGVAALEKIILFGSTAGATALVWRP